eukprot:scaffold144511_cov36-Prasinocladus_malaysianus.AAC.1
MDYIPSEQYPVVLKIIKQTAADLSELWRLDKVQSASLSAQALAWALHVNLQKTHKKCLNGQGVSYQPRCQALSIPFASQTLTGDKY